MKMLKCDQVIPERYKHIAVKGSEKCAKKKCEIACNEPTTPGDMTERGCTYAGCRGVVGGPVKDVIHLTHGPTGCAFYSWGYRPHLAEDTDFHREYIFVSDLEEKDIIFGGEKKLLECIVEAAKEFPEAKGVFIYNTCAPALIGDDGRDVAKQASELIGKPVVFFPCEGFRGVSQSQGHHVGNLTIFQELVGTEEPEEAVYGINLVGEYNIKGDLRYILPLFKELGVEVLTTFTGNASIEDLKRMHRAKLNVVHCARSATYIAEMMKEAYGIPYIHVTLWGLENTANALRKTAEFFSLEREAERLIEKEMQYVEPRIEPYRRALEGKTVFIYQGAPRAWHWVQLMRELGMEVTAIATTFGHRDDYDRIFRQVKDGTLIIDNPNALEIEEVLEEHKPDLFISGNKEKYLAYKMGMAFVNGHTYDSGPYAGFRGMIRFARDIHRAVTSPVWKLVRSKAKPAGGAS